MSDDQSDFANKVRRSKAVESDGSDAPEPTKSDRRKAARQAKRAERKASASEDRTAPAPALASSAGDEEQDKRKAEKAARKAEHKAERAANRASRKESASADANATGPLSDGERAKSKAERKAEKTANKADRKKGEPSGAAAPGDDERAKAKAERKALKAAKKADRKEGAAVGAPAALAPEDNAKAQRKAEKAAKKAARKAEKAANKESGSAEGGAAALSSEEEVQAKAERKAQKKAAKKAARKDREGDGDDSGNAKSLRVALRGLNGASATKIRTRIEAALSGAGVTFEWAKEEQKSSLAICGFEDPPADPAQIAASIGAIAKGRSKFHIFVGRAGSPSPDGSDPLAAENHAIAMLACTFGGAFIDTASLFRRYGADRALKGSDLTDYGAELIAAAILGVAAGGRAELSAVPRPQSPVPEDLAAARALSADDLLSQLSWSSPITPKLLWTHASKESLEAFLDRKVALSDELSLGLDLPISWPVDISGRAAEIQALGLEFLSGPLNYWYGKANNRSAPEIDALVKERGVTAGEILTRAGRIIVDFADAHPFANSKAWEENAVSRRARVLALFVLCCKMAAKRKVKFDEGIFLRVFSELLNLIEVLRAADFYQPGSSDGVQQDSLVAGLALGLRKIAYAEQLLIESMERLKRLQLNVGLTADGVWRIGTFSDHCTLLTQFRTMLGDFNGVDDSLKGPVAAAAKKMTVFAEALLKSNGSPPVFDDSPQKPYLKKLSGTHRALAGAGFSKNAPEKGKPMARITDTYVFRDAQYFASHTTQKPLPDSSLVILYRELGSVPRDDPGGISLAFAFGANDLLVCADPPEGASKRDKGVLLDAALRNGYRINGAGYTPDQDIKPSQARLVKSWRGEGWAAAKSIDETNSAGSVTRTVIHLKDRHALIVVDALKTTDGTKASFEQVWHIAPGLTPPSSADVPLHFAAAGGNLTAAFDTPGTIASEPEGEGGTCVRRSLEMSRGVVASLFQWTDAPVATTLKVLDAGGDDWSLEASGADFDARISLEGDNLRYEPKTTA